LWDAVIVAYPDRWSKDNAKSKEGLEVLRQHGKRFFVGTMEMNLFDPNVRLILGVQAEIGEFLALQTAKKSMGNRIARAQRGVPVCGHLPFGRTWDKVKGEWGIDEKKQALIAEAARRYLAGESLVNVAAELGIAHSFLHATLMERCGTQWL